MKVLELTNTDEFWRVVFEAEGWSEWHHLEHLLGVPLSPDTRCLLILESSPGGWNLPPVPEVNPAQEELSL